MSWKLKGLLVLLVLLAIFAIQNAEVVTIRFLFWSLLASRVFVIFGCFVLGLMTGWVLGRFAKV